MQVKWPADRFKLLNIQAVYVVFMKGSEAKYYRRVLWLAVFTIAYNGIEGMVSVLLGIQDETLVLLGFGIDSFAEVISGAGILLMIIRIRSNPHSLRSQFERTALRITGTVFYLLAAGLLVSAVVSLRQRHKPETTLWGVVVAVISLLVMTWLYRSKIRYGRILEAEPVIADGRCTLVCIYMSAVLLASSVIYELTGFGWVDTLGALGLMWFSFTEGRESFEKAAGKECECDCSDDHPLKS
jgi:divalent metal cation (Fe/Co/Zn/Cd) transporter